MLHRQIVIMKIEMESLRKETDASSRERLDKLRQQLAGKEEEYRQLNGLWEAEKKTLDRVKRVKRDLDAAQMELRDVQRKGDLARASELMYGRIPQLQRELPDAEREQQQPPAEADRPQLLSDAVTEQLIAKVVAKVSPSAACCCVVLCVGDVDV